MYIIGFGACWFVLRVEMKKKILLFMQALSEKAKDYAKKSLCHFGLEIIGSKKSRQGAFVDHCSSVTVHII